MDNLNIWHHTLPLKIVKYLVFNIIFTTLEINNLKNQYKRKNLKKLFKKRILKITYWFCNPIIVFFTNKELYKYKYHFWHSVAKQKNLSADADHLKNANYQTISHLIDILVTHYTVACKSLGTPCRICENVNNINKIREIIHNACYFLFSTVLSKIFYIIMFTYSPTKPKISEIIKITPFKSLWTLGS